jgi:hypothetical protein
MLPNITVFGTFPANTASLTAVFFQELYDGRSLADIEPPGQVGVFFDCFFSQPLKGESHHPVPPAPGIIGYDGRQVTLSNNKSQRAESPFAVII